jgi:hypothetical protein
MEGIQMLKAIHTDALLRAKEGRELTKIENQWTAYALSYRKPFR